MRPALHHPKLFQGRERLRQRLLPQPSFPEPESGDHLARMDTVLVRPSAFVSFVRRQDVEIGPLLLGIDDSVLPNSAHLVLGELLSTIPQAASACNDLDHEVRRTVEIDALEPGLYFLPDPQGQGALRETLP